MFNDAIGEALNVFLSRMKGAGAGSVISTQSNYLKKMGTTALSAVGNSYDPILERYINHRVVVALKDDNNYEEFCGFLKEYSSAWLSLLDCKITHIHTIDLDDLARLTLQRDIDFFYTLSSEAGEFSLEVTMKYYGVTPSKVLAVKGGDNDKAVSEVTKNYQQKINKTLKRGESLTFTLDKLPDESFEGFNKELLPVKFAMVSEERRQGAEIPEENEAYQGFLPEITLVLESTHITDVYLPRTLAVLRHGAE